MTRNKTLLKLTKTHCNKYKTYSIYNFIQFTFFCLKLVTVIYIMTCKYTYLFCFKKYRILPLKYAFEPSAKKRT